MSQHPLINVDLNRGPRDQRFAGPTQLWQIDRIAKGNYAACYGSGTYEEVSPIEVGGRIEPLKRKYKRGAFGVVKIGENRDNQHAATGAWKFGSTKGTSIPEDFPDGSSKTLAVSEVIGYPSYRDCRGGWVMYAMGTAVFSCKTPPNAQFTENPNPTGDVRLADLTSGTDMYDHIGACESSIPNQNPLKCIQNQSNGNGHRWAAARSGHTGGVNAVMADGSGFFFADDIDLVVWRALSTRAGYHATGTPYAEAPTGEVLGSN